MERLDKEFGKTIVATSGSIRMIERLRMQIRLEPHGCTKRDNIANDLQPYAFLLQYNLNYDGKGSEQFFIEGQSAQFRSTSLKES
jgi:hypothetical protein